MEGPLLIFDGNCGLCHGVVQFIMRFERAPTLRFASLQSPIGRACAARAGTGMDTLIFAEGESLSVRSDAVIRVARHLVIPWCWLSVLRLVPRPIRDGLYNVVARHRLGWFGGASCHLPVPAQRERFLS